MSIREGQAPGNRWIELRSWPPYGRTRELHLAAGGALLERDAPAGEAPLLMDPDDPVPTLGGANLFPWLEVQGRSMGSGSYDQRPVEARDDVLVFTSETLDRPVTVMGRVRCVLWVRPDTLAWDTACRRRCSGEDREAAPNKPSRCRVPQVFKPGPCVGAIMAHVQERVPPRRGTASGAARLCHHTWARSTT